MAIRKAPFRLADSGGSRGCPCEVDPMVQCFEMRREVAVGERDSTKSRGQPWSPAPLSDVIGSRLSE
jgi:hypothetical protein